MINYSKLRCLSVFPFKNKEDGVIIDLETDPKCSYFLEVIHSAEIYKFYFVIVTGMDERNPQVVSYNEIFTVDEFENNADEYLSQILLWALDEVEKSRCQYKFKGNYEH